MTIDERLDRLTERHEALTQSVEILLATTKQDAENIVMLLATTKQDAKNIEMLLAATKQDAENIRALARIADMHDRRLTRIERGEPE